VLSNFCANAIKNKWPARTSRPGKPQKVQIEAKNVEGIEISRLSDISPSRYYPSMPELVSISSRMKAGHLACALTYRLAVIEAFLIAEAPAPQLL
jgi:hypothetical protein